MTPDTVSIDKQAENAKKPEAHLHRNCGEHCKAELRDESASSPREIVLNAICLLLLLASFTASGYVAVRWIERQMNRPLWHALWHEPLDDWGALTDAFDFPLRRRLPPPSAIPQRPCVQGRFEETSCPFISLTSNNDSYV
jgi:hypothetical protein